MTTPTDPPTDLLAENARLRAQLADHWPASGPPDAIAASHQQRDRLYALCQSVGVVRENQWLSEAAVAAIEKLLADCDGLRAALAVAADALHDAATLPDLGESSRAEMAARAALEGK